MTRRFVPAADQAEVKREKERARELRRSGWWKRRIATGLCHYCGARAGPRGLTMDHVIPLIRGGKSTRGNIVPACKECNSKKKSLLPWEWDDYLQGLK